MNIVDQAGGVVTGAAEGMAENESDQEDSDRVIPVEKLEAVVLDALVGVGPLPPADGAGDHHQQGKRKGLRREHAFSLNTRGTQADSGGPTKAQ